LFALGLLGTCLVPSAHAVGLLSQELTLFLPWVEFQQRTYSALLSAKSGTGLSFALDGIDERQDSAPQGALASVSADLQVTLPLVSFGGELYSATLSPDGEGGFQVASAAPFVAPQARGAVSSLQLVEIKTVNQILSEFGAIALAAGDLRYDVAVYRVGYQTLDPFGNLTPASGIVGAPLGVPGGVPLLSVQHGTIASRADAPSVDPAETGADLALYLMGASGYLTLVPDYLGFGDSTIVHPFVQAKTLAWSVIDLIRATRSLAVANSYPLNGQVFLVGYSEGGYATMAAQREIEIYHGRGMTITASAPMAGPYDLSGTMLDLALSSDPVPSPLYFPYVLLAYNGIYGFDDDVRNLLAPAYGDTIVALFDGEHDSSTINAALPSTPRDLYDPDLLAALDSGAYHPLRAALENNDVYRWTPVSPTRLYHCLGDDQVPYDNATVAHDYFTAVGADVELVTLLFGDHSQCAVPALLAGKAWFDSLAELP
jgi:hypothetical protein